VIFGCYLFILFLDEIFYGFLWIQGYVICIYLYLFLHLFVGCIEKKATILFFLSLHILECSGWILYKNDWNETFFVLLVWFIHIPLKWASRFRV
jgi:hypothetical protein